MKVYSTPNDLELLCKTGKLSRDGCDWFTQTIDPFHDYELRIAGLPDHETASVIVETIKESYTVSAPPGTTGLWQAHVFNSPESINSTVRIGSQVTPFLLNGVYYYDNGGTPAKVTHQAGFQGVLSMGSATFQQGLLNIHAWDNNTAPLSPDKSASGYSVPNTVAVLGSANNKHGKRRLVSLAYEIHDTTAEMYKQGTLTAYRLPQTCVSSSLNLMADISGYPGLTPDCVNIPPPQTVNSYYLPPTGVTQAMAYQGTRQWEVREGAYVVCAQDVMANRLDYSQEKAVLFTQGDSDKDGSGVVGDLKQSSLFTANSVCVSLAGGSCICIDPAAPGESKPVPYHTTGIILSGLNPFSTFTVTMRATWEFAPNVADNEISTLVYLANPSPEHDPFALELYQQTIRKLPVAVPVSMNAKGDFWRMVLSVAKVIAKPLLNLIPVVGGAAGSAADALLGVAEKHLDKKQAAQQQSKKKASSAPKGKVVDNTNFNSKGKGPKRKD